MYRRSTYHFINKRGEKHKTGEKTLAHPKTHPDTCLQKYTQTHKRKNLKKDSLNQERGKNRTGDQKLQTKNHITTLSSWRSFSSAEHQRTHSSATACKIVQTFGIVLLKSHSFQCFQISHATITMSVLSPFLISFGKFFDCLVGFSFLAQGI